MLLEALILLALLVGVPVLVGHCIAVGSCDAAKPRAIEARRPPETTRGDVVVMVLSVAVLVYILLSTLGELL